MLRRGFVCALALLAVSPAGAWGAERPVVRVESGLVRGVQADGVDKFLGLPYAAPARRWVPPEPPASWQGVRDASAYGNSCAQVASGNGPRSETEDCLYLNIYRPPNAERVPVLFWIHGGGLRFGSGEQHDGWLLARTNGIVVVSINYRLGVFGYLAFDGAEGNYGLLDQQAALRWVNRNIAAFGGDPARVTVAGESAGGWSVCANLASPAVRGLIARAILQSANCGGSRTPAESQAASAPVAEQLGCTTLACLRARPASALLDAGEGFMPRMTLTTAPAEAVASGDFARVPVLFGVNADEGRYFAVTQGWTALSAPEYEGLVGALFGDRAPAVLTEYPLVSGPYASGYALGAIITDSGLAELGGCPARTQADAFAARVPTYFYEFADRQAPPPSNEPPDFEWGAAHTLELPYMWPSFNPDAQLTPAQRRLSDQMVRYWGAFTRLGVPAVSGQPVWPPHTSGRLLSLQPGITTITAAEYAAEHNCSFWNSSPTP